MESRDAVTAAFLGSRRNGTKSGLTASYPFRIVTSSFFDIVKQHASSLASFFARLGAFGRAGILPCGPHIHFGYNLVRFL